MLDNTANTSGMEGNLAGRPIAEGTTVYDAGGDKVGTVSEHNVQGGYLVVHKGWLFPKDVYIPLNAIGRADMDGVYLNMYKDDLKNQHWENPPTGAGTLMGTGTGLDRGMTTPTNTNFAQAPDNITGTTPRDDSALSGHPTPVQQGDVSVPLREEELIARKERDEAGAGHVHVSKDVVEEPQSINVPVSREEVRVERVPVEGARAGDLGPDAFQERDIDVPVMGERVNVEKQARVGEELHLHKREVTEQQRYGDTVRREQANVEGLDQQGDMPLDDTLDDTGDLDNVPRNNP